MSADKKPGTYLLNYVELVPGTLQAVYDVVSLKQPLTLDQVRDLMWIRSEGDSAEDHVLNALNFLYASDVLTSEGNIYRTPFGPQPPYGFRALLLKGLRAQPAGKQRHIMDIHELLVRDGCKGIGVTELMGFLSEQKFFGPVKKEDIPVNDFKLGFWMRLLDFIGVVHQMANTKAISLTPDHRLLYHLLTQAAGKASEVSLQRFLEQVEKEYFCVTTRGDLHQGVADALVRMRDRGLIDFRVKSDAMAFQLTPAVAASHIVVREGTVSV